MRPLTILVDMDSILADFCGGLTAIYNAKHGTSLDTSYFTDWDTRLPNGHTMFDYFSRPGFFRSLPVIPGSQFSLKNWIYQGHEVIVVSTATLTNAPSEKYEWLKEHFQWIPRDNIVFAKRKYLVRGDVLIDDYHLNVEEWKKHNPSGLALGIEYEYNRPQADKFDYLFDGYENYEAAWHRIRTIVSDYEWELEENDGHT